MKISKLSWTILLLSALLGCRVGVTGVSLDKSTDLLAVGGSDQLTAIVSPADATVTEVAWTTSDSSVAAVDSTGLVTGGIPGTATITATTADGGMSAACQVTVTTIFAGYYVVATRSHPCYWEGTTFRDLAGSLAYWADAYSPVAVAGGAVYTAGHYGNFWGEPCYWEGTVFHDLALGNTSTYGWSIAVSNGVVYITGQDFVGGKTVPYYLEGSTYHGLGSFAYDAYSCAIAAANGTVYVAGALWDGVHSPACYWEGTTLHTLDGDGAMATSIVISDGIVYMGGFYSDSVNVPCYWQGTTLHDLRGTLVNRARVTAIAVSGGTVYTAGWYDDGSKIAPCYWEGTTFHSLAGSLANEARAYAIEVGGGRVYTAGWYNDGSKTVPCYWEGDTLYSLEGSLTEGGVITSPDSFFF